MTRSAAEQREIGVRQLERIIDYLGAIKAAIEHGSIHYQTGELIVTKETTVVEHDTYYGTSIKMPLNWTYRIHGDITFGTEQKD